MCSKVLANGYGRSAKTNYTGHRTHYTTVTQKLDVNFALRQYPLYTCANISCLHLSATTQYTKYQDCTRTHDGQLWTMPCVIIPAWCFQAKLRNDTLLGCLVYGFRIVARCLNISRDLILFVRSILAVCRKFCGASLWISPKRPAARATEPNLSQRDGHSCMVGLNDQWYLWSYDILRLLIASGSFWLFHHFAAPLRRVNCNTNCGDLPHFTHDTLGEQVKHYIWQYHQPPRAPGVFLHIFGLQKAIWRHPPGRPDFTPGEAIGGRRIKMDKAIKPKNPTSLSFKCSSNGIQGYGIRFQSTPEGVDSRTPLLKIDDQSTVTKYALSALHAMVQPGKVFSDTKHCSPLLATGTSTQSCIEAFSTAGRFHVASTIGGGWWGYEIWSVRKLHHLKARMVPILR